MTFIVYKKVFDNRQSHTFDPVLSISAIINVLLKPPLWRAAEWLVSRAMAHIAWQPRTHYQRTQQPSLWRRDCYGINYRRSWYAVRNEIHTGSRSSLSLGALTWRRCAQWRIARATRCRNDRSVSALVTDTLCTYGKHRNYWWRHSYHLVILGLGCVDFTTLMRDVCPFSTMLLHSTGVHMRHFRFHSTVFLFSLVRAELRASVLGVTIRVLQQRSVVANQPAR